MDFKKLNRIIAFLMLAVSSVVYLMTTQPTFSFWDCGEFIASAYTLSVPHPPGAPLWMLIGKLATMLPFSADTAFRMNAAACIASGFTVMFLYLTIVMVIKNWRGEVKTSWDAVIVYSAAVIGALSYGFCDAFWFNAIESEVYSLGTTLIAFCTWLLLLWWEKADTLGNEKYLFFFSFMVGVALGIHLLVVQVVLVGGVMLAYRKNKDIDSNFVWKYFSSLVIFFLFAFFLYAKDISIIALGIMSLGILGGMLYYIYNKFPKYFVFSLTIMLTGLAFILIYPVITIMYPGWLAGNIKSINITDSKIVEILAVLIIPALIYGGYRAYKAGKRAISTALSCIFFVFLGYSIYAGVILRANVDDLPLNEGTPKDLNTLVSYLSREQYGDAKHWPRRYSEDPMHRKTWTGYTGDFDFMWRWQINHMFNRYLAWQYIGRAGYIQDMGVDWSKLYGIPFLIGLFGLFYHFRKDWKFGITFLWMFLLMGVLSALFQRQQEPQPRERDYFYTGAFFVFSLWIGLGSAGIFEMIKEGIKKTIPVKVLTYSFIVVLFAFIPLNMIRNNYHYQDRSKNYVPFDYAYNILQSVDKNGIVFTNGDNDTFPLWCLQAVYGIRTDVRVVNLSLLNLPSYIKEMKNTMPYGALKVPINMPDAQIDKIQAQQWGDYKVVTLIVPSEAYPDSLKAAGNTPDKLTWKMPATINFGNVKAVQIKDIMMLEIIKTNNWQRPIFYSATVSEDNFLGLDEYLVNEGMALRLVPFKGGVNSQVRVDEQKMYRNFFEQPKEISKTPQSGFLFRGLNDPTIFFDQTASIPIQNYRSEIRLLAYWYANNNMNDKLVEVLDKMEQILPRKVIPMDYRIQYEISMLYYRAGRIDRFNDYSAEVEVKAREELNKNPMDINNFYGPYRILLDIYEAKNDYSGSLDILQRIDRIAPGSSEVKAKIESLKTKIK